MDGRYVSGVFNDVPIHSQGIAFSNIAIAFKRKEVDVTMDDALSFTEHLCLGNPQCSGGNSDGKIVYLYAV